jgi:adenylosuccinate lyase
MGFERVFAVTGQTYPRQLDFRVCQVLAGIAQSASKFAVDLRLSAGRRELEEPFEAQQIGSSAMPWKRNPMRCERMLRLARHVIALLDNSAHTAANQWFERTLDDSANRRLSLAESFLATDAILQLYLNVRRRHRRAHGGDRAQPARGAALPRLRAALMAAVRAGADRQDAHERLRLLAREAALAIHRGEPNPLRRSSARTALRAARRGSRPAASIPRCRRTRARAGRRVPGREVEPVLARYAGAPAVEGEVRV